MILAACCALRFAMAAGNILANSTSRCTIPALKRILANA